MEKTSLAEKYKDVSHLESAGNVVFLLDKGPSIGQYSPLSKNLSREKFRSGNSGGFMLVDIAVEFG